MVAVVCVRLVTVDLEDNLTTLRYVYSIYTCILNLVSSPESELLAVDYLSSIVSRILPLLAIEVNAAEESLNSLE